jgi:hypothetical protein
MAVYIRKLANRRNVENIVNSANVEDVCADSISAEFRTKDNKLSIYKTTGANEALIKRYTKAQLKEKIGQAKNNGWINNANANDEIKKNYRGIIE